MLAKLAFRRDDTLRFVGNDHPINPTRIDYPTKQRAYEVLAGYLRDVVNGDENEFTLALPQPRPYEGLLEMYVSPAEGPGYLDACFGFDLTLASTGEVLGTVVVHLNANCDDFEVNGKVDARPRTFNDLSMFGRVTAARDLFERAITSVGPVERDEPGEGAAAWAASERARGTSGFDVGEATRKAKREANTAACVAGARRDEISSVREQLARSRNEVACLEERLTKLLAD